MFELLEDLPFEGQEHLVLVVKLGTQSLPDYSFVCLFAQTLNLNHFCDFLLFNVVTDKVTVLTDKIYLLFGDFPLFSIVSESLLTKLLFDFLVCQFLLLFKRVLLEGIQVLACPLLVFGLADRDANTDTQP